MNEMQVFNFNEVEVRTVMIESELWWVAKDVCDVLEMTNTTVALSRLDNDEVTKFNLGGLSGETNIINESGLYSLIMGSRKPEAKTFKKWVTGEVLPTIRKTGVYAAPTSQMSHLDILELQLKAMKAQEQKILEIETKVDKQEQQFVEFKEHIVDTPDDWREGVVKNITACCTKLGGHREAWSAFYKEFEHRSGSKLDTKLANARVRMENQGVNKTKINQLNKLDMIGNDKRLKVIASSIAKEFYIKYKE